MRDLVKRVRLCWRILRGRPVAYRMRIGPAEIGGRDGQGASLVECQWPPRPVTDHEAFERVTSP